MRVQVLGAGIIGLSVADELLRRGHEVVVVDRAPGTGASFAAAGMLSPSSEVWHGEAEILRFGREAAALWPEYAARLGVPLHRTGTVLAGMDRGDLQHVERQLALLAGLGAGVELLTGRAARGLEPGLSPRIAGAALLVDDHSVDPRHVVAALLERVGDRLRPAASGGVDATVVATGARLPEPWAHLVRGVRGEILRARTDDPPARTVRAWVRGEPVYVVPRADGGVVIGATSEEHDAPPEVTLGGAWRLLDGARQVLPGLDRAFFAEACARDRPATADHLPLVGSAPGRDDVVLAAGLFRHGVLLAPLVARLVADHLEHGHLEAALDPRRFADPSSTHNQESACRST
ncbi:FAD-dependent oxidoreductase [Nocardioides sp. AE5]|uniref:FAD-dependent oxidoreductase n=1 Tax=Nocardioides sp. AE5 TaxID=2962573 RepID=UPI0028811AF6|nr:FAD-dependent oxidoreductase [Nocardioides sp. AE5]MDT0202215.1 FAD-dependent oxidoreductase [Nocardioides sp. AE5]